MHKNQEFKERDMQTGTKKCGKWTVLHSNESFIHVKNINYFIMYAEKYWKIYLDRQNAIFNN